MVVSGREVLMKSLHLGQTKVGDPKTSGPFMSYYRFDIMVLERKITIFGYCSYLVR